MKKRLTRLKSIFLLTLLCAAAFTCLSIVRPLTLAASASSTINVSGRVFQDYNGNGIYDISGSASAPAIDLGIPGVIVTAYDPNNVVCGSDTTLGGVLANRGEYHMKVNGVGPYRIEFTNLPAGYFPSGTGTDSDAIATAGTSLSTAGTTEQFIPDKTIEGVNLGLNYPSDYCQNNPDVCTNQYLNGDSNNTSSGPLTTLWRIPYNTPAGTANNQTAVANKTDIGAIWGQAFRRTSGEIFTGAFLKRHVGVKNGLGSIFVSNKNGTSSSLFIDLAAAPYNIRSIPLGAPTAVLTNSGRGLGAPSATSADPDAFPLVGKAGLGDLELSADDSALYVVNLSDQNLYKIIVDADNNPSTPPSAADVSVVPYNHPTCNGGFWRPFGLGVYHGDVYLGGVCDALSSQLPADLHAYIFRIGTSLPVLDFPLDYPKGIPYTGCASGWFPWTDTMPPFTSYPAPCPAHTYPQPVLSDIAFDNDGSMIIGFFDRFGHQIASNNVAPDGTGNYYNMVGGDILRAYNKSGTFALEINGSAGPNIGTPNNDQGPGPGTGAHKGGEFYSGDNFGGHQETSEGGLAMMPGATNVVFTTMDPLIINTSGLGWLNNSNGTRTKSYGVHGNSAQPPYFGKSNGVGDVELMCDLAPIEIGNRIWNDTNGNGTQDAGEMGIPGVTVHLFKGNLPVTGAGAVTDANGEYYFSSAAGASTVNRKYSIAISPNTAYEIRLDDPANFAGGGPLAGLSSTTVNVGGNDSIDSDASDVNNPVGSTSNGTFPVITLTTGGAGANDHTFDIGFTEKRKEACCGTGENYVKNGNFDDGPKEFKSKFTLADTLTPGDYTVGNSETAIKSCENWDIIGHTNCKEDNNFLIVNGMTNQTTGNALAWGQDVQVPKSDKDETYHFCAWFKDLKACCFNQHPKITLEADIKGHNASTDTEVISAPSDKCGWQLVSTDVTVPAGTSNVNLQILLDQNADGDGNDVAIDDISFAGSAPVPAGATDFNIATQVTGGSTDYGITATPLNPQKPDCKYTWTVFEVTPDGASEITPPLTRQTWASTGVSNFPGYFTGSTSAGIFQLNHTYRITYRIDCDCMTAREDSFDIRRNPTVLHGLKKGGKNSPAKSDFTITRVNPK